VALSFRFTIRSIANATLLTQRQCVQSGAGACSPEVVNPMGRKTPLVSISTWRLCLTAAEIGQCRWGYKAGADESGNQQQAGRNIFIC